MTHSADPGTGQGAPQAAFDALRTVAGPPGARMARLVAASRLRDLVVKLRDPVVRFELEGTELRLRLSHDLPWLMRGNPGYGRNLTRVSAATLAEHPGMSAIDIGANVGDSVALMRAGGHFPILCIEGAAEYCRLLEANVEPLGDVVVEQTIIGEAASGAGLQTASGTGHLASLQTQPSESAGRGLAAILEENPAFGRARLVKIDLDGLDAVIIEESAEWLAEAQPVLFFEYAPGMQERYGGRGLSVFTSLLEAGYRRAVLYDNRGGFLHSVRLEDSALLEEAHAFAVRRWKSSGDYLDVCAFVEADDGVADRLREMELGAGAS